jgi:MoCo/4Fe-4S cofactor protein with predicted Tat translocation signal
MSQNKYWQSFGEIGDPENFKKKEQDEFREELPFEGFDDKGLIDAKAPRRDFLKYLGFSTAAATLASCKVPVRKAIPYANKPADLIPGEAKYYATTYVQEGNVIPVVAKVRDGRPIKIEGNSLCSYTQGGTSASVQASVLDLYDTYRVRFPQHKAKAGKFEEVPTFEQFDKLVGDAIAGLGGATVVLLTETIVSPSSKQIISEFLAKYPGGRHIQADAVSYSGLLLANEASGKGRKLPDYKFDKAKVIVSLGADFLGTWLSPVEFSRGYSKGRKIDEKNPAMSKHFQFESHLSMTGANADERFTHRPSETGLVALALLSALNGSVNAPAITDSNLKNGIAKAAAALMANRGAGLVVCGSNDVNVQTVVNAINRAIGANGTTIDWSTPVNYRQGIDKDLHDLVAQMDAGQVGALIIHGANPAYNYHDPEKFKAAMKKVRVTVSLSAKMDETAELCNYILPDHHYLESWGDAEPKPGYTSFIQPTIYPLFKTRAYQTSLLKWSGNTMDYETYFRNYWMGKLGGDKGFNKALQDGVIEPAASNSAPVVTMNNAQAADSTVKPAIPVAVPATTTTVTSTTSGGLEPAVTAITGKKSTGPELVIYQKVSMGTGAQAGNPWLQEFPDPITKASWDNYAMISIPMAKSLLGIDFLDRNNEKQLNNYEYYPEKPVIRIEAGNRSIELPVLVIPGMNADTIAVAVGYGRNDALGVTAAGIGKNVYHFAPFNGTTVDYYTTAIKVSDTGTKLKLAQSQVHNSYEDRIEVVRETTLATFKKDPDFIVDYRNHLKESYAKNSGDFRKEGTLYGQHDQPGIKWGMSIDMNSCTACGACVVACHAENNVPVVGKREVLRYHDMHWLRIDRYFVTDHENPDNLKGVVFQPMLCQHCDNAPCENVCPVAATNHSSEGINQMAYNRCIGTRYCANNCPFKVRRFNWADYTGADSFPDNQDQSLVGKLDDVIHQMNDDLTRMVLNPDVTVRSRGVMEKCTFCIQKLQYAKLDAKKQNRPLVDGEAKTACMTACPTEAIVFGNAHDQNSWVNKVRNDNPRRSFYVLEQLHVLPNITYLAKVRNTDEVIETAGHGSKEAEHVEQSKDSLHSKPSLEAETAH